MGKERGCTEGQGEGSSLEHREPDVGAWCQVPAWAGLGERDRGEQWLVTAVRLPGRWVLSFLVSPGDLLADYTWCGPAHEVRLAVANAVKTAGLADRAVGAA